MPESESAHTVHSTNVGNNGAGVAYTVDAARYYGSGDAEVRALDGVDASFGTGEFTAIMGPSGSGKSTLMHCMAGLDTLTSGQVFIDGEDITAMSDRERTLLRPRQARLRLPGVQPGSHPECAREHRSASEAGRSRRRRGLARRGGRDCRSGPPS